MIRLLVVIPARLESTRLPRKPLVDLDGKPMIVRTYERCAAIFPPTDIVVATDSEVIANVCLKAGIASIMTSDTHLTGTDRVAEVARQMAADVYINVQGDEPLFEPDDLVLIKDAALRQPELILNGYCPIGCEEEFLNRATPKVVFDADENLLYLSRSPIPGGKSGEFRFGYRQVCAYAFPANSLKALRDHPEKTNLEKAEDIELLRFLELGHRVKMLRMSDHSIPVDHPEDVGKVLAAMRKS